MTNDAIKEQIMAYLADGRPRTLRQVQCAIGAAVLSQPLMNGIAALVEDGAIERVNGGVVKAKGNNEST